MSNTEGARLQVKETCVLKKFDGDWTDEQIEAGEADADITERIVVEDGVIVEHWVKEGARGPQDSS
jgi:hypothetical protein